jgi:two-component system heavy metal sensor histidine kinase CusS
MSTPISITARMSLLFALSAAGVLLIAGAIFEQALNARFLKEDTVELEGKMEVVRNVLSSAHKYEDVSEVPLRLNDIVFGHPGIIISVRTGDGVLFSAGDRQIANQLVNEMVLPYSQPATRRYGKRVYRFISSWVRQGKAMTQAVIALDITDDQNFVAEFQRYLWFGMALVLFVLGWLSWIVVRHGLAPLRKVSTMVAAISTRQLDKPLTDKGVPSELHDLVAAFNTMLARLDDSFRRLSEFSSDIAHELRTPIHNLLIQTQVTLGGQESLDTYRSVLQSNEEEYQRLSRMISDMLFLAKADNKQMVLNLEDVKLHEEVASLFDFYEALASDTGITLQLSGTAQVFADRLMIQRALSNLLSNAIRFTPPGMAIKVDINNESGWVNLAICNPGPEIPQEFQELIFERLYRVDPSRREGHTDNVGLGLAITKSIVEMHNGLISVISKEGLVTFLIRLPRGLPENSWNDAKSI